MEENNMKCYIAGKLKDNGVVTKINLMIPIEDPNLIDQIIKKNGICLHTEKEVDDLKREGALIALNKPSCIP